MIRIFTLHSISRYPYQRLTLWTRYLQCIALTIMPLSITTPIIMIILWSNFKKVDALYVLIRHLHIRAVCTKTPIYFQVYKAVTTDRPTLDLTDHFTNRNINFLTLKGHHTTHITLADKILSSQYTPSHMPYTSKWSFHSQYITYCTTHVKVSKNNQLPKPNPKDGTPPTNRKFTTSTPSWTSRPTFTCCLSWQPYHSYSRAALANMTRLLNPGWLIQANKAISTSCIQI